MLCNFASARIFIFIIGFLLLFYNEYNRRIYKWQDLWFYMNNIEKNLSESFRRVRQDIVKLQEQVLQIVKTQAQFEERIGNMENKKSIKTVKIVRTPVVKSKAKHFIASKTGKKFHISECIFTKNIKPKDKLVFKSKNTALNAGYKPCDCVK